MPLINTQGQVLAGAGGIQGSLDGVPFPFPSYGGGSWQTEDLALVQLRSDATATWRPDTEPLGIGPGANDQASNGNAWIAWRGGPVRRAGAITLDAPYGVFGTLESRLLGQPGTETPALVRAALAVAGTCGPRSVGPDGTIAYIPDRQFGYGIRLVAPDGTAVDVPQIAPLDVQVISAGVAIWRGGAVGRLRPRVALADAQGIQVATLARTEWVLYWSEQCGLVLQENGALEGWILDSRPLEFNPSMAIVGSALQIAWSITQGEGPDHIVVCQLTTDASISYLRRAAGWVPQVPRWTLLPPPVTPPIEPPIEPPPIKPPIEPPPTKPPIEPPPTKPPVPSSPIHALKRFVMADTQTVHLVGPAGQFAYPDALNTGPWAEQGWRGVKFKATADDDCKWELSFPDNVHAKLKPLATGGMLGMDATKFATNVCQQWYVKATEDGWGGYEALNCYQGYANGTKQVQMDFDDASGKYSAASLTIVVL